MSRTVAAVSTDEVPATRRHNAKCSQCVDDAMFQYFTQELRTRSSSRINERALVRPSKLHGCSSDEAQRRAEFTARTRDRLEGVF